MIEKVISDIHGVGMYGVISICLFFAFFTGVLVWAGTRKKSYLKTMGDLPLDDGSQPRDASEKIQS
jgi:hypothetical protein